MGLTDVRGITRRAVEGALLADPNWTVDVVVGQSAESLAWLRGIAPASRVELHVDLDSQRMAELMVAADMAIGGGGGTSLERCCMAVPSLVILLADNQRLIAETLCNAGAAKLIGDLDSATPEAIAAALRSFAELGADRLRCSQIAASIVDGEGADRVSQAIVHKLA